MTAAAAVAVAASRIGAIKDGKPKKDNRTWYSHRRNNDRRCRHSDAAVLAAGLCVRKYAERNTERDQDAAVEKPEETDREPEVVQSVAERIVAKTTVGCQNEYRHRKEHRCITSRFTWCAQSHRCILFLFLFLLSSLFAIYSLRVLLGMDDAVVRLSSPYRVYRT